MAIQIEERSPVELGEERVDRKRIGLCLGSLGRLCRPTRGRRRQHRCRAGGRQRLGLRLWLVLELGCRLGRGLFLTLGLLLPLSFSTEFLRLSPAAAAVARFLLLLRCRWHLGTL